MDRWRGGCVWMNEWMDGCFRRYKKGYDKEYDDMMILGDTIKGYDLILGIQFDLSNTEIVTSGTVKEYDPSYLPDFPMSGPDKPTRM